MAFSKWNNGMMGLALVFQYFFIPMTQIFMDICGSEHFSIMQQETIKLIDITEIEDSPYQGRFPDLAPAAEETSATDELAVSIEKNGLMQVFSPIKKISHLPLAKMILMWVMCSIHLKWIKEL